jgi:hypothetical protein
VPPAQVQRATFRFRRWIHEPFVFNSYEKPTNMQMPAVHIVLEVLKL